MRIGIDAAELQGRVTGTGRYLRNLLREWSASGEDTLLAYFPGEPPEELGLDASRVTIRALPRGRGGSLLWRESRLAPAARRDGLDVFFSPAYVCPLSLDAPRVTTVHDVSFFFAPDDFSVIDGARRRALVAASLRASAAIVAVSDFTRREILALDPGLASSVFHVPHGLDDDLPRPPPRDEARARLRLDGPLVLTVGSVFNRRCIPVLLRAAASLAKRWPGLILDVVGENRTQPRLDLDALVASMGLTDAVRLSGYVSENGLADRYAAADVAVFLSEYEGFGLPALEAMARGLPVLTSTRPSLSEIFGEAALLVEPRDAVQIASSLDSLLRDHEHADELRARGAGLAARFSWRRAAARTRDVLAFAAGR